MKDFLIKAKIALDRGKYWLSYLNFLLIVFIAVTNMKEYNVFSAFQSRYWILLILVLGMVGVTFLGWLDIKKLKTFQREAEIYSRINPVQQKIFKNQEDIIKRLKKLERKLK